MALISSGTSEWFETSLNPNKVCWYTPKIGCEGTILTSGEDWNDGTKCKVSKIFRTTSRIRDRNGLTGNVRKSDALHIRNTKKNVTNIDGSGFRLPLSGSRIQPEIWCYSRHNIAEGDGRIIGKSHDLAENYFDNQRLTIILGADSIRNKRTGRDIAKSDRNLLIHVKIRQNRCARDIGDDEMLMGVVLFIVLCVVEREIRTAVGAI